MTNSSMTHEHYIKELCNLSSFLRRLHKYMFKVQLRVKVYIVLYIIIKVNESTQQIYFINLHE